MFEALVRTGQLAKPQFAFWLSKDAAQRSGGMLTLGGLPRHFLDTSETLPRHFSHGGMLILGGADEAYYTGEMHFVPITRKGYWQFDLAGVKVGGPTEDDTWVARGVSAIADTGTSLLVTPAADFKKLVKAMSPRGARSAA